ncbi:MULTISPECIES: ABC transporter substrate-binding protein [unclassified Janthinobacterium]|uniref:substrate-binding periplasmic protein n=1 Tax=unclassified Janthinobacterium TaxID=2610881 RepID=UPI001614B542|nr:MULTISPECIES: transporter substrate-binding domain-containing protein [unclassified Janthinobacterium]MBB5606094.1 ABC-type amino acid transport substrate-binding protein [Janthinobacterium sp. S3T4]MBB5616053.1 ABC-type amino acid transport substrate-binding protein [Janthinobacterium sp. S3M3]
MLACAALAAGMVAPAMAKMAAVPAPALETLPARLVCHDDVFVPYVMLNQGRIEGLNVDILREAATRLGIAIEFRVMPWRRLENELAKPQGSVDCAFAMSRTPQREQYLEFGKTPLQPTEYALFVRQPETTAAAAPAVTKLDDLAGKVIGVRAGFRLPEAIAAGAAQGRWTLAEVPTDTANFQKLALRRIDAVLADSSVGLYTLKQLKLADIRRLAPPLVRFDTYLVFRKNAASPALAAAFDRELKRMRQDGTFARISAAYLGVPTLE